MTLAPLLSETIFLANHSLLSCKEPKHHLHKQSRQTDLKPQRPLGSNTLLTCLILPWSLWL